MTNIPGLRGASVVGAIGALVYSEAKMQAVHAKINNRDPRQRIIEEVLNEAYSFTDLMDEGKKIHLAMQTAIYKALVKKWCDNFGIEFNEALVLHSPKHSGCGSSGVEKSDQALFDRIAAEIKVYDEAADEVQTMVDELPWYSKVNWNAVIWTIVIAFGFVTWAMGLA